MNNGLGFYFILFYFDLDKEVWYDVTYNSYIII